MVEVRDVVFDQERQGVGLAFKLPGVPERRRIDVFDRMREMPVQRRPELAKLGPRQQVIALHTSPAVLLVARQIERGRELQAHDALLVVHGRVAQVAKRDLEAPLAGGRRGGGGLGGDGPKGAGYERNAVAELPGPARRRFISVGRGLGGNLGGGLGG